MIFLRPFYRMTIVLAEVVIICAQQIIMSIERHDDVDFCYLDDAWHRVKELRRRAGIADVD